MSARFVAASTVLALAPVLAGAGSDAPPPSDTTTVTLGSHSVVLWPYTGTDFSGTPSDPVNLFFLDTDPRQLRQALLHLSGERPPIAPVSLPFDDCRWMDGMGSEQTGWAETRGWVGGEVQLVCTHPSAPLGDPFRIHVRLFRQGPHTVGAAHLDILIPGTAQHESLSWDLARDFVANDMQRIRPGEAPKIVPLITPGRFGSVPLLLYGALVDAGLGDFLGLLGVSTDHVDSEGNPTLPTSGDALAFSPHLRHRIRSGQRTATTNVQYQVITPKPFCASSPYDFVLLQGPVQLEQTVQVDYRGRYTRNYRIYGELTVTPWNPVDMVPAGAPVPAIVQERHRAVLTGHHGQVFERGSQELLGDPAQSYSWFLAAGVRDYYEAEVTCGP